MKTSLEIVHGGGWVKDRGQIRPKTRLFSALAAVWLTLAICSLVALPLNGWEALAMFAPVPVWLMLAIHFFCSETPRPHSRRIPNPGHHLRKLY